MCPQGVFCIALGGRFVWCISTNNVEMLSAYLWHALHEDCQFCSVMLTPDESSFCRLHDQQSSKIWELGAEQTACSVCDAVL